MSAWALRLLLLEELNQFLVSTLGLGVVQS